MFFTLIPVLALLSNYDRENCLINLGTEGRHVLRLTEEQIDALLNNGDFVEVRYEEEISK